MRMNDAIWDIYMILLKLGGKVVGVQRMGVYYVITTMRPVTYRNEHTGEESTSDYPERFYLRAK